MTGRREEVDVRGRNRWGLHRLSKTEKKKPTIKAKVKLIKTRRLIEIPDTTEDTFCSNAFA